MFITVLTISRQIVSILSQMSPVHANSFDFLKNHFNIVSSTPRYSKRSPSFRFPHKMKYQTGVCERFGGPQRGQCNNFNIFLRSWQLRKVTSCPSVLREGAQGGFRYSSSHSWPWYYMEGRAQPHSWLLHPPVEEPRVPLNRGVCGPQTGLHVLRSDKSVASAGIQIPDRPVTCH